MTGDVSRDFMERVVVWPGANEAPGWINLHSHWRNNDPAKNGGKPFVVGWPFKTVDAFMGYARWIATTNDIYDVWFCTAQQRECVTGRGGKPKALRRANNATWLKAIWLDVDIKERPGDWDPAQPWPHYETIPEAWSAISGFRQKVGLPAPSNVVLSGGGLHVYWIAQTPFTPSDWRPYAEGLKALAIKEGLKCDAGLTSDNVRILRVPGTLNHKYDPPRLVEVVQAFGPLYDFPKAMDFLTKVNPEQKINDKQIVSQNISQVIEPGFDLSGPDPLFAGLTDGDALTANLLEKLLNPEPIFEQCGFLKEARDTGGKDFANPLWNLSLLCASFMEDGNDIAHQISHKHPSYDKADTQAQYDRKVVERTERGIGYPSCATIQSNGCKSCEACPLFAKGKSPLNIRPSFIPKLNPQSIQKPTTEGLNLPPGYAVLDDGCIYELEIKKARDGAVNTIQHQLFYSVIDMPWVQKNPDVIHFRASYDLGNIVNTKIRKIDWCGPGFEKKFGEAQVKYVPKNKNRLEQFLMSWLARMHAAAEAQQAVAFGWYRENGELKGFAYGGFIHLADGRSVQAGLTDRMSQANFAPTGEIAPWYKAARFLTQQKRPELDLMLAISFAAPLMMMTGTMGAMFSAYSIDSGSGKTYATELGAAVWGHPKATKETSTSSWKNVEKRLGATVNLPLYWDEIHDEKAQKACFDMVMVTTGGVTGGKLKQNREFAQRDTWATLLSCNSNRCFKDFIQVHQPGHVAGLNRVFEINPEKPKPEDAIGKVPHHIPEQALADLCYNFGNLGLEYGKILGKDFVAIQARVNDVLDEIVVRLNPTEDDRFYVGMAAALIVGAELATKLNVELDVPAMKEYLYINIDKNRASRAVVAQNTVRGDFLGGDLLTGFRQRVETDTIWVDGALPGRAGRATALPNRRLFPNTPLKDGVQMRYDTVNNTLSFSKKKFMQFCFDLRNGYGYSETAVMEGLKKAYKSVTVKRATLGAGTPFDSGQEWVIVIPVPGNADLEAGMKATAVNIDLGPVVGLNPMDTAEFIQDGEAAIEQPPQASSEPPVSAP